MKVSHLTLTQQAHNSAARELNTESAQALRSDERMAIHHAHLNRALGDLCARYNALVDDYTRAVVPNVTLATIAVQPDDLPAMTVAYETTYDAQDRPYCEAVQAFIGAVEITNMLSDSQWARVSKALDIAMVRRAADCLDRLQSNRAAARAEARYIERREGVPA